MLHTFRWKFRIFFLLFALLLSMTAITQAQTSCSTSLFLYEIDSGDYIINNVDGTMLFCFHASANEIWRFDAGADDLLEFYFYRPGAYDDNLGYTVLFGIPSGGGTITSAILTEETGVYYLEVVKNYPRDEPVEFSMQLERLEADEDGRLQNTDFIDAYGLSNLGYYYETLGNYEAAIDDFEAIIELDPRNTFNYLNLGVNYTFIGDMEAALENFEQYSELDATAFSFYWVGIAHLNTGDYEAAVEDFETVIEDDGVNPVYYYLWLGIAYQLNGDEDDAEEAFSTALEAMDDSDDELTYQRKQALLTLVMGDADAAQEAYEAVLDIAPQPLQRRYDLVYLVSLAGLFPDEERYSDILEWFREEIGVD